MSGLRWSSTHAAGAHLPVRGTRGRRALRRRPRRRAPARWSACSAPPAPASRRCSACSPGSSGPAPARSSSAPLELSAATPRQLDEMRARDVSLMLQGASRNLLPYFTPLENVRFAQGAALERRQGPARTRRGARRRSGSSPTTRTGRSASSPPVTSSSPRSRSRWRPQPGLLLADEPTSQLDHPARDLVLERMADGQPRARHHRRPRHPRPRRGGVPAPHHHHPRRPGRRRGPQRRGVRRGHARRLPPAAAPRPRGPAARHAGALPPGRDGRQLHADRRGARDADE